MAYGRSAAGLSPQTARQRPEIDMRRRDGHILVWVLGLLLVAAVLSAAVITFALNATRSTEIGHNTQQAQFTAKSAASAAAQHIIKNALSREDLETFIGKTGTGGTAQMGEYTVTMQFVTADQLKITATGKYKGQTAQESVTLVRSGETPTPFLMPTDHLFYLTGSAQHNIGNTDFEGDVFLNGNLSFASSTKFSGSVVVRGTTAINGGASITMGNLFSFGTVFAQNGHIIGDVATLGNMEFSDGGKITGNVTADGDLKMPNGTLTGNASIGGNAAFNGGGTITGNLTANGNLTMPNGKVLGNVSIGGNAAFDGGGDKIGGLLTLAGTVSVPSWATVTTFVPKGYQQTQQTVFHTPVDASAYQTPELPLVTPPTEGQVPGISQPLNIPERHPWEHMTLTLNKSGTINGSVMQKIQDYPAWQIDNLMTIDATAGDIHLIVDNVVFDPGAEKRIKVISNGTSNVYFYLKGTSGFRFTNNNHIKTYNTAGSLIKPRVFIFGNAQEISANNSEIYAHIYVPNGKFSASGGVSGDAARFLWGTCVTRTVASDVGGKMVYSKPDLSGTPLDGLITGPGGGAGGGSTSWAMGVWSGK